MKRIFSIILIMAVCTLSACTTSSEKSYKEAAQATALLKANNDFFYYNTSADGKKLSLYKANIETKESQEIDSFTCFSDMYFIDGKIYYMSGDVDNGKINIYSYDKKLVNEGQIEESPYLLRLNPMEKSGNQIFEFYDGLAVLYNDTVYVKQNDKFEMFMEGIVSAEPYQQILYYSDLNGKLHKRDGEDKIIVSDEDIKKFDFVEETLGGEYKISQIKANDTSVYFLVSTSNMGKIFKLNLSNNSIEQLFHEGATSDFTICNDKVYYYDYRNHKVMCYYDGTVTELKVPSNIYAFDVWNDIIYYAVTDSESAALCYYSYDGSNTEPLF